MKKITITLSDNAEKYFNEVMYSLDTGKDRPATHSEVINEIMESNAIFESYERQSVSGYVQDTYQHYSK